jgi:hypothetical protein
VPDAVEVAVRQDGGDHEGQVVAGEVGGAVQGTDHGTLLFDGLQGG